MTGKVVTPKHRPPLTHRNILLLIFRGWVDRGHMDLSDASKKKFPVTRPGIDPLTFHMNYYATPGPIPGGTYSNHYALKHYYIFFSFQVFRRKFCKHLIPSPCMMQAGPYFWQKSWNTVVGHPVSPGVGNLLVVLCQSNVTKSLSVPT